MLNPSRIRQALALYPDPEFVDMLCNIATHGARIGYEGPLNVRMRRHNHQSAHANSSVVSEAVMKELEKGRIASLQQLPEFYFCSPVGVVPKRTDGIQTGWRLIFDLSCPDGKSVNDGIPVDYGTISYEALDTAIRMVAKAGRGAKMIKRDLKSAFRFIPVSSLDRWCLIFEWEGQFYVELFLPFGLRTSPRIFNLFSEAIHWVLETIYGWMVSHYLDDFFGVFPADTEPDGPSQIFDATLGEFGFVKANEKDEWGTVVTHLGFQFDSDLMEVRLPPNKHARAIKAVSDLLSLKSAVPQASLEETLGFLSHCCQVIPLGRPFLRQLFSLLKRKSHYRRIRLNSEVKQDLRWWKLFLSSWSTISLIQLSRPVFYVSTDASGLKGIGGVYDRRIFSSRVPTRHKAKHINWKEMFAVLHALILWHREWINGSIDVACDNTAVVGGINKRSIVGPAIRPLRAILLIAAVFDIEIKAHWIPTEENVIADAASRHDFKKLANLGFKDQVTALRHPSAPIRMSTLRQQLTNYFKNRSLPLPTKLTPLYGNPTSPSALVDTARHSQPPSYPSPTGSPPLPHLSDQSLSKVTCQPSAPTTLATACPPRHSMTRASISSLKAPGAIMGKENVVSGSLSPRTFSSKSSPSSQSTLTVSTFEQQFVWDSLRSSDRASLLGNRGILQPLPDSISQDNISNSPPPASPSSFHRRKQPLQQTSTSISPRQHRLYAPSPPYVGFSLNAQPSQMPQHLRVPSATHSQSGTSSKESTSISSVPAFLQQGFQGTPCGRVQRFLPKQKASQRTKSRCWGDGRAMQSTFISMNSPNPPLPPILQL